MRDSEEDTEAIKKRLPFEVIFQEFFPRHYRGSRNSLCPWHEDREPSLQINEGRNGYCHACENAYDIFDVVMLAHGCGFKEAKEWLREKSGLSKQLVSLKGGKRTHTHVEPDFGETWEKTINQPVPEKVRDVLVERGVWEVVEHLIELGCVKAAGESLYVPMTTWDGGIVGIQEIMPASEKARRYKFKPGSSGGEALLSLPGGSGPWIVTESFIDACSVRDAMPEARVLTIFSASSPEKLVAIKEELAQEGVILFFDNDPKGREAVKKCADSLGFGVRAVEWAGFSEKDVNELLGAGRGEVIHELVTKAVPIACGRAKELPRIISLNDIHDLVIEDRPLIAGLLGENESLLLVGPGGIGKSMITLHMALHIGHPQPGRLWSMFEVPRTLRTYIIQSENSMGAIKKRQEVMCQNPRLELGRGSIMLGTNGRDCRVFGNLADKGFQAQLIEDIKACQADLLILDPLISYHQGDENDNAGMRRSLDGLTAVCDEAGVGVVVVHHMGKVKNGSRGASAIEDWAANIVNLQDGGRDGSSVNVKVGHAKARNYELLPTFSLKRVESFDYLPIGLKPKEEDKVVEALKALGGQVERQADLEEAIMKRHQVGDTQAGKWIKAAIKAGRVQELPKKGRNQPLAVVGKAA